MAQVVIMRRHPSGLMRPGYVGFSWTTLFFGAFPALFRDDFLTFLGIFAVLIVIGLPTLGIGPFIAMFVWAFSYNRYYTRRLIEKGYVQADTGTAMVTARMKLVSPDRHPAGN